MDDEEIEIFCTVVILLCCIVAKRQLENILEVEVDDSAVVAAASGIANR